MAPTADVGVIGGSGFTELLPDLDHIEIDTPYGPPSGPIAIAEIGGRRVAFVNRHGPGHVFPPHRVPYRANSWALRSLGVTKVISPCAVGSLRHDRKPGDLVVLDQLVDRTWGRTDTFWDQPGPPGPVRAKHAHDGQPGGAVMHLTFADPYDAAMRATLVAAARGELGNEAVHDGGTVAVIQGPRFSTRAESRWFAQMGWDVVNMTQHPEVALLRELDIAVCGLALVTDYDAGVEEDASVAPVTMEQVFAVLAANVDRARRVLFRAIPNL